MPRSRSISASLSPQSSLSIPKFLPNEIAESSAVRSLLDLRANELRTLQSLVTEHREEFLEAWHEFFGIDG